MSCSWTRVLALSMTVCLVAILAAPAMAAGPSHGRPVSPAQRTAPAGILGRRVGIFTSLQVLGFPVVGPLALLPRAGSFIWRFVNPSARGATGRYTVNRYSGPVPVAFNRSALYGYPPSGIAAGAREVGFAGNLTGYLGGKGYNVSDLDAALSSAKASLAASNLTALRSAMRTFQKDLDAKIAAGTLNRTAIRDYLKTISAGNGGFRAWEVPARWTGMPGRHLMREPAPVFRRSR